jgi:hypothetical protein
VLSPNAGGPRFGDTTPLALSKICRDKNDRIMTAAKRAKEGAQG